MTEFAEKEITKLIWSLGDYEQIAKTTLPAALALVEAAGIASGSSVLDVATGSGNVAMVAAGKGARITGCDITPAMVELARSRAEREGLDATFEEGDAEELPFPDESFDVVLSVFGAMFAPQPDVATKEMFRVLRPDGVLGMANWMRDGTIGRQTDLLQSYSPTGVPDPDPLLWGDEATVKERFAAHSSRVDTTRLSIREEYGSWDEVRTQYEDHLGPAIALRSVLPSEQYDEMMARLQHLYESENLTAGKGIVIESGYLQVIATKAS